jgi:hypothetical protein
MRTEELRRYDEMYTQMEIFLGTSFLQFGHPCSSCEEEGETVMTDREPKDGEDDLARGYQAAPGPVSPL